MKKKLLFFILLIVSLIGNVGLFAMNHTNQQRVDNLAWAINQNYDAAEHEVRQKEMLADYFQLKNPGLPSVIAAKWASDIYDATTFYSNVSVDLALQVTDIESKSKQYYSNKNLVVSNKGAVGMFQVMPGIWGKGQCPHSKQPSDLQDSTVNTWCGVYILSKMINKYGNIKEALTHYYGGNTAVELRKRGIDITDNYAERVLASEA